MKIKFDIQQKYKEIEIHLCGKEKNKELLDVYDTLERLLDTRLKAYKGQESKVLSPYKIVRIYSANKKVYIRTMEDCYEVKDRLYTLEELLRDRGFVRISNSEIVNSGYIDRLDMSLTGTIKMCMKNGDETYVSRRYVSKIKDELL